MDKAQLRRQASTAIFLLTAYTISDIDDVVGMEQGENPMEALKREIREEVSYLVQNPKFVLAQKVRDEEKDCDNTKYVLKTIRPIPSMRRRTGDAMVFT